MTELSRHFDVVVIGGGPAGVAAAVSAAETDLRVAIVDDNPAFGGQVWRQGPDGPPAAARRWLRRLAASGVETVCPGAVFDLRPSSPEPSARAMDRVGGWPIPVGIETPDGPRELVARRLVLATGATERFLPFPGWTLPGVTGAGGLQALIKGGLDVAGRRVVVAGSGPLLLAVADLARRKGADVRMVAEQAPAAAVARFARGLWAHPAKALQGLGLGVRLLGTPLRHGTWPIRAEGQNRLQRVVLGAEGGSSGGREQVVECDLLACGFGLVPSTALARYLGCAVADDPNGSPRVLVDPRQQTSVPGVFAAGEPTGIGGVELSLLEGRIAGHAAAGRYEEAHRLFAARQRSRRFARRLESAFALRPELRRLPDDGTPVCRCEDVRWGRLRAFDDRRDIKLKTRCGMGPCQGRVCGAALDFLFEPRPEREKFDRVRPPFYPVTLDTLARIGASEE